MRAADLLRGQARSCSATRCVGWFLNCLGAFPVRRGESDEESIETSLALLERGEAVVIFPEGTRIRAGSLGRPKRGVGRLALESGAPVVPIAVTGQRARPPRLADQAGRRCTCAAAPPLTFPRVDEPVAVPRRRGDRAHLALRRSSSGSGSAACRRCAPRPWSAPARWAPRSPSVLARAGLEVQLGCRTRRAGRAPARASARTPTTCPAWRSPEAIERQDGARDRVRRRGPGRARRAVQQPARRRGRGRRPHGRAQRRAGGLEGARAAARHHAHGLRGRARAGARGGLPRRARARARGDRGRAPRWCSPPRNADLRRQLARGARRGRPRRRGAPTT